MAYFWLVLMIGWTILEMATVNLVSIWFAGGSLVALVLAALNCPWAWQLGAFLVTSTLGVLLYLFWIRPNLKRQTKGYISMNADRIIGHVGVVTVPLNPLMGEGRVLVDGQDWRAETTEGKPLEKDTPIRVLEIRGTKLMVQAQDAPAVEKI